MINLLDINSAVITHLRNEWPYTDKIEYQNGTVKPEAPWIRPAISPLRNSKKEVGTDGSSLLEQNLIIDVFTVLGKGIGESSELVSNVMNIFKAGTKIVSDDDVIITFTSPDPLPGLEDGYGFWQDTVHCPFSFYHK